MSTVTRTTNAQAHSRTKALRSVDLVTEPLRTMAKGSSSLVACESGRWESEGRSWTVPQFIFLGPTGGVEPLRIGLFAGIHGDELAAIFALVRFARLLEENPEIARGFTLFLYPVCNPTGFEANTRENSNGKDLNREFWRNSTEPEIQILESELRLRAFDGIIALHTDDTSDGAYGYARGPVITRHLLPNSLGPIIVATAFGIPNLIIVEAILGYLGIGLKPSTDPNAVFITSWGVLLQEGQQAIFAQPWLLLAPAICVALVVLSFNFLGDGLRDALDPRMRGTE